MSAGFDKFRIKRSKWWNSGNFEICDSENQLAYNVRSSLWKIKKVMNLTSVHGINEYRIEASLSWANQFKVYENDQHIATIDRPFSFSKSEMTIETTISEPFQVKGNVWSNEYKFIREREEFAIVSSKIWSSGEFGIAVKEGECIPLILSIVVVIGFLIESGMR